jgi:hypothetical protein
MRKTMRPITLGRVFETCIVSQQNPEISADILSSNLGTTNRRSKEILEEMIVLDLFGKQDGKYVQKNNLKIFIELVRENQFHKIHLMLLETPFYSVFYQTLDRQTHGVDKGKLLELLVGDDNIAFNNTSISVLCDWGERLGSIQRNVFDDLYYTVKDNQISFKNAFLKIYQTHNIRTGVALSQKYVEIPKIREYLCQAYNLSRDQFDESLIVLYKANFTKLGLSGAPITTKAKISSKKVKNITVREIPDKLIISLSSDKYLRGIELEGRYYYYIAYHGGELVG